MIKIENISVDKKYSILLYFSKDYKKENLLFSTVPQNQKTFGAKSSENHEKEIFKRNFGALIEDGLEFAQSEDLRTVRNAVDGLTDVLKLGRGTSEIEPHKAELFRIYNGMENVLEKYVIIKLWHELLIRHREINSIVNTMRKKQWKQIGAEYAEFADKMLMPFENKFTTAADVNGLSGEVHIEPLVSDNGADCVFRFDGDILPLYVLYMTELARHGKSVRTCDICGGYFIAARKDTCVCGEKCKAERQKGYSQEHKERVKGDSLEKLYQGNRAGYDSFLKQLKRLNSDEKIQDEYLAMKKRFLSEGKTMRKKLRDGKITKPTLREFIVDDRSKRLKFERNVDI